MENSVENIQRDRCLMRERYIRATANLAGKQCTFTMLGGESYKGVFRGADIEFHNIIVDGLDAPTAKSNHSILRSTDIMAMTFTR